MRQLSTEDAIDLIRFAFSSGITLFDTARDYENSEEKLGIALKPIRDKVTICSKMGDRLPDGYFDGNLKQSLDYLQTDYLDIYCFQGIHSINQYNVFMEKIMPHMIRIKKEGIIKKIGITGHDLGTMIHAVQNPDIDVYMFPMNILYREPIKTLVPLFRNSKKMLFVMKPIGGPDNYHFFRKNEECTPYTNDFDLWFDPILSLNYLKQFPEITSILLGFTTKEQVTKDLRIMNMNLLDMCERFK